MLEMLRRVFEIAFVCSQDRVVSSSSKLPGSVSICCWVGVRRSDVNESHDVVYSQNPQRRMGFCGGPDLQQPREHKHTEGQTFRDCDVVVVLQVISPSRQHSGVFLGRFRVGTSGRSLCLFSTQGGSMFPRRMRISVMGKTCLFTLFTAPDLVVRHPQWAMGAGSKIQRWIFYRHPHTLFQICSSRTLNTPEACLGYRRSSLFPPVTVQI